MLCAETARFLCWSGTRLGRPVEPLVWRMRAISPGWGEDADARPPGAVMRTSPDASNSAVVLTKNLSNEPVELRVVTTGQSRFIGSISPGETNSIVLDPSLLPSGELYIVGIAADGRQRAVGGPLAVTKGNTIHFTIEQTLSLSRAYVVSR